MTTTKTKHTCEFKLGRSKTTMVCACGKFKHLESAEKIVGVPSKRKPSERAGIEICKDWGILNENGSGVDKEALRMISETIEKETCCSELLELLKELIQYEPAHDIGDGWYYQRIALIPKALKAISKAEGTI